MEEQLLQSGVAILQQRRLKDSVRQRLSGTSKTALALALLSLCAPALAKSTGDMTTAKEISGLRACRAVAQASDRATCYDRVVDSLVTAIDSKQLVVIDHAEVRRTRRGLFGFAVPRIPFLEGGSKDDTKDARELIAKVTSLRSFGYGLWRFQLDDGSTWETSETSSRLSGFQSGDSVTIERGVLGAFFLNVNHARVQARRIS